MRTLPLVAMLTCFAAPSVALAEGDVAAGKEQFERQCVACHVLRNDAGEVVAGRSAKSGPNLYGLTGKTLGSVEAFRYGDSIVKAGEGGAVWDEESFVGYVQNPTDWLRENLDDRRARGKMAYQVRDTQQAYDIYAFIASVSE